MAQSAVTNPDFYSWNKAFIHYCDGASMGSSATEPIPCSDASGRPTTMWMRGRNNFDAIVAYLQTTYSMSLATEVILSGGSAGGLAVFYNLDHLRSLLAAPTRLVGFPDAGFFLDAASEQSQAFVYRSGFVGADPVWNITGSGGTNLACLAAYEPQGEAWKCLLAPYLSQFIKTPLFVMNSLYDTHQISNILQSPCVPSPISSCTATQNASLLAYRNKMLTDIWPVIAGKPQNGVYLDGCYVHEQNVNYCSTQSLPNCVGWSPLETGSQKWGYSTAVRTGDGRQLTPQQAFGAYYRGDANANIMVDQYEFFDNPTCLYLGKAVSEAASLTQA
jgi:hypothetical protein